MRIARIGSMNQPIPATEYGGTQRSMAQMTAFQAAITAHDITLYGPADSAIIPFCLDVAEKLGLRAKTSADGLSLSVTNSDGRMGHVRLRHTGKPSTGYDDANDAALNNELLELFLADEFCAPYDLIHSHYRQFTTSHLLPKGLGYKTLTHQHTGNLGNDYAKHNFPVICISHAQAELFRAKFARIAGVVHHGLDPFTHEATAEHAGYLAWIGRFLPDKGAHRAIEIAQQANRPLILAGTIYEKKPESAEHFNRDIAPRIDYHDDELLTKLAHMTARQAKDAIQVIAAATGKAAPVIFAGSANEAQKQALYGHAMATLFPISWSEPFGRVMIESMACGTPVIANTRIGGIDCGSVREVVQDGVTGLHIDADTEDHSIKLAVEAVGDAARFDRNHVRAVFNRDWSSERVANQLDGIYRAYLKAPDFTQDLSVSSLLTPPANNLVRM